MKKLWTLLLTLTFFTFGNIFAQNAPTFTITVNSREVDSLCLGIAPPFTCTSASSDLSWNFGDGKTGIGISIPNQYVQAGTYHVTLKDNTTGLSTTKDIIVNPVPKSSFSISANSSCTGTPITFTSTSSSETPIILYQWDFGNGTGISKSEPSTSFSYNSSGTFTPSLIVQDKNGCTGSSINNPQIQIGASDIQASFQANGESFYSCDNTINLVNNSTENGRTGISYTWDFGDNNTSNVKNPGAHTYSNPGVYNISLKASYGGIVGCTPGFTKTVYIGKPTITINAQSSICANALFPLEASSNMAGFISSTTDLNWQIDNGNVLNGGNTGYFNNVSGNNSIRATNTKGCPNTATTIVNVLEAPQLSLSLIPTYGICIETEITAKVSVNNLSSSTISSYEWTLGDGSPNITNTIDTIAHTYRGVGSYALSLKATNTLGCSSGTQTVVNVKEDCTDNGYGTTYNPVFSFESVSCENKYTITLKNKNLSKMINKWVIEGQTIVPDANQMATVTLTPPAINEKNKRYLVQTYFNGNIPMDEKKIEIIDEKANFAIINTENPTLYCASNKFIFSTDTSVNIQNISKFSWSIINNNTSETYQLSDRNPSFTFPKPGNYSISLTIYDVRNIPCTSTIAKTIDVKGMAIDFNADSTTFCYLNPKVSINVNVIKSDADLKSLYWTTGDGQSFSVLTNNTQTALNYQYNYSGNNNQQNYDIYIEASDNDGCRASTKKYEFIKIFNPKVSFNKSDTLLCSTKKILIQNTSNVPSGDYLWKVGDYSKLYHNLSQFNHTFDSIPNPSSMDVYLKVTDAGGCTKDTLVKNYIRFAKPNAHYDIANQQLLTECPPYTLVLRNKSINTNSVKWTITDRNTTDYTIFDSLYYTARHPGKTVVNIKASLDGCSTVFIDSFTVKGPVATLKILDTIGCTPYTSKMVISHNDDVNGYQWDLGDGTNIVSALADSIAHTYKMAGRYTPKVYVSGYEGCTDSLDFPSSIVAAHLSPTLQAFNVADKCTFDTAKFLNTAKAIAIPIQKYVWNWGDVLKEDNNSMDTIRHIFPDTSMYIPVSLTAITDYCTATSDTVIVSPHFANNITISGDSAFCDNINLHLSGHSTQTPDKNNIFTWYDNKDSIIYSGLDSLLVRPMDSSLNNTIKLKLTNTFGCTSIISKNIQLLQSPIINLEDSIKLCRGDSLILQSTSNGSYNWTSIAGNIDNPTSATPTVFPNQSSYYLAEVTNTDNCKKLDSIWIQVDSRIGATFKDNYKSCLADTVNIMVDVKTAIPSIFTWTSQPEDNTITNTTSQRISVNPRINTTYHFVVHSQNVCPDEAGDILLEYAPVPIIHFANKIITQPAGTIFQLNPTIENLTQGTKFTWSPDTRLDNRYLLNPSVVADKDVAYSLSLLDEYGCTTTESVSVKVLCNSSKILMANAFTPNGDGKNDRFFVTGYGIKNVVHFSIVDRWGKKVFERNNVAANDINQGWDGTINGKPSEAGTYLYLGELECMEGNKIPIKGSVVLIR